MKRSGYGVLVDIILGIRGWISPSHLRQTIFLLSRRIEIAAHYCFATVQASIPREESTAQQCGTQILFLLGWVVLQKLGNSLRNVLLLFFWFGLRVDSLARSSSPHQILVGTVIHVKDQLPDIDRGCRPCGCS